MKPAQFLTYQIIFSSHKNERSFLSKRPRNWLWKIILGMIRKIINTYSFSFALKKIKFWTIISRRKPSTELPDAIKELSTELNALASQTEIVKRKIDELVQQKSLVFKLIKQEITDYGAQLFTMYQVDLNFSNLEKACKSIRKVEQTWRTIER